MRKLGMSALLHAPLREGGDLAGAAGRAQPFAGMNVLVVEDDFIVAFDLQTLLEEQGAHVLGPAASLQEARAVLAGAQPDAAILDINLNGEYVFPLVEDLRARDVPFVFATAYTEDDALFPEGSRRVPRLSKPVLPEVLIEQLQRMVR